MNLVMYLIVLVLLHINWTTSCPYLRQVHDDHDCDYDKLINYDHNLHPHQHNDVKSRLKGAKDKENEIIQTITSYWEGYRERIFASDPIFSSSHPPRRSSLSFPSSSSSKPSNVKLPGPYCMKTHGQSPSINTTLSTLCTVWPYLKADLEASIPPYVDGYGIQRRFARARLFGAAIRLVFHDAGEYDGNSNDTYGIDGCLSSSEDNMGLYEEDSLVYLVIEPLYQKYCHVLTRADFWVLYARLVLMLSSESKVVIDYSIGRSDHLQCELGKEEGRLPNAQGGLDEIERVFIHQMGLKSDDAVALMGGHSLGHVHPKYSGYGKNMQHKDSSDYRYNAWDETPEYLDNLYYVNLLKFGWRDEPMAHNLNGDVWIRNGGADGNSKALASKDTVMINPDMAIAYPVNTVNKSLAWYQICGPKALSIKPTVAGCNCPGQCSTRPRSEGSIPKTKKLVEKFAKDEASFHRAFRVAFEKMISVGYEKHGKFQTSLVPFDLGQCELTLPPSLSSENEKD